MKIQGSVALVTGGAQGIGEQICRALLERGGKVAIFDVDREKGLQLKDKLEKQYGKGHVTFITCDVTSNTQMKDSFKKAKELFGQINIVCNNAGIGGEKEDWEKVVNVNLKGVILGQLLGILHMGQSHQGAGGSIVNVASMAGLLPMASDQSVYAATKFGVIGLTQSSKDLKEKEGIRVNCICPSFTRTRLVLSNWEKVSKNYGFVAQLGLISPELVASGIVELIEDESHTGSVMTVTKKRGIEIMESRNPIMRKSKL